MKKLIVLAAFAMAGTISAESTMPEIDEGFQKELIQDIINLYENNEILQQKMSLTEYWYWFTICGSRIGFGYLQPSYYQALQEAREAQAKCEAEAQKNLYFV